MDLNCKRMFSKISFLYDMERFDPDLYQPTFQDYLYLHKRSLQNCQLEPIEIFLEKTKCKFAIF